MIGILIIITCLFPIVVIKQEDDENANFEEEDLVAKAEDDFFAMINADKKKREKQLQKMRSTEDNKDAEQVCIIGWMERLLCMKQAWF